MLVKRKLDVLWYRLFIPIEHEFWILGASACPTIFVYRYQKQQSTDCRRKGEASASALTTGSAAKKG